MWSGTVVLFSVLAVTLAAEKSFPLELKPEQFQYQEGCYLPEFGKVVPFGEAVPSIKTCIEYRCKKDRLVIAGCGLAVYPLQEVIGNVDKPYPECCPKV